MSGKSLIVFISTFSFILFWGDFCLAAPLNLVSPTNGASNVPVDDYFKWDEVTVAAKYILDIAQFTQSEDNISPGVCSGGICYFGFLDLTIGSIDYLTTYNWKVTAYNTAGDPIDSSSEWSFTTEMAPVACNDGIDNDNDGKIDYPADPGCTSANDPDETNGGPGGPGSSPELVSPIAAKTLKELFTALINFLFYLAMSVGPIMIIWAAFLILTAAGKAEQVNKGKTIILWTLIAIAIVLLAKGLPSVIKGILGG